MTLLEEVRAYALAHYEDAYYWSMVVECYEDRELQAVIDESGATTLQGYKNYVAPVLDTLEDRWADAQHYQDRYDSAEALVEEAKADAHRASGRIFTQEAIRAIPDEDLYHLADQANDIQAEARSGFYSSMILSEVRTVRWAGEILAEADRRVAEANKVDHMFEVVAEFVWDENNPPF